MGLVAVAEAEGGSEVAAEEILLLDGGKDSLVDGLLVAGASASNDLLLLMGLYISIRSFRIVRPSHVESPTTGAHTWGFSPCLKKASSVFFSVFFSLVK